MASLMNVSRRVLDEARDGIAWIAVFKRGRGWDAEIVWPEQEPDYSLSFGVDDLSVLSDVLKADRSAILVNGYYCNLGPCEDMTVSSLCNGLRWQYGLQCYLLADAVSSAL